MPNDSNILKSFFNHTSFKVASLLEMFGAKVRNHFQTLTHMFIHCYSIKVKLQADILINNNF